MKRVALLSLVCVMGLSAAAEKRAVYVNVGKLAEQSKAGAALQRDGGALQEEMKKFVEKEQAKLAELEKKGEKGVKLEAEQRRAQISLEEKRREMEEKMQVKFKELQMTIMDEVKRVAQNEGWSSVSDASVCLYVDADLDQTDKVLAALNKTHDAKIAKAAAAKA